MRCPRCGTNDATEQADDEWWWCDKPACRFVFKPEQPARLIDTEPRARRDID